MIDTLLNSSCREANQCISTMNQILGVASGDAQSTGRDLNTDINIDLSNISQNLNRPESLVCTNAESQNHNAIIESLIGEEPVRDHNAKISCLSCRNSFFKHALKQKKIYSCPACEISHVFSPFSIISFAPYKDMVTLQAFAETLQKSHEETYRQGKEQNYWTI
jgi:hypothetical protein